MELTPKQQIVELTAKSKNILIVTHVNPDGDALGSTLALANVLKKLDKNVVAICSDIYPKVFDFLPNITEIKRDTDAKGDFVISIDTSRGKIEKLGYKNLPEQKKLNIVLTPDKGVVFTKDDITFTPAGQKFDLIFVLDAPDEERLGDFYVNNPDLFYEVPIVNIDHHPSNSYYGKVNWVDLTSTSTAEILVALIESLGRGTNLFDSEIATLLLTGIITDTGSFQHNNTTPKSLTVAAQLVAAGGRQQEIIKHIFKTKRLSTLKIWGKVLSNITEEVNAKFIYSKVNATEFKLSGADPSETSGVTDELLKTAPGIDFALLLTERDNNVHGSFRASNESVDVAEIAKIFGGGGHKLAAAFQISHTTLADKEDEIISTIKDFQLTKFQNSTNASVLNNSDVEEIA